VGILKAIGNAYSNLAFIFMVERARGRCDCPVYVVCLKIVKKLSEAQALRSIPEQMEWNRDSIRMPPAYCLLILLSSLRLRRLRWKREEPLMWSFYF
jgi:hypothetical protein